MMKVASGGELVALPAGAEGGAGRSRLRADAGLRRDRHRRRRRGGRRHRRSASPGWPPRVQVLSVTHAPQVAARAAHPFPHRQVRRQDKRLATGIAEMDRAARQEEIARMLAGATITEEARAAADRLLAENAG